MENRPKIYFISGHRDITTEEFEKHYARKLRDIMLDDRQCQFVVGDYHGCDEMAQLFLLKELESERLFLNDIPSNDIFKRVTVYHMFDEPNHLASTYFQTKGGFKSDEERDAAMTRISDEDIAWVREGKDRSGTARNIERRQDLEVKNIKYNSPNMDFSLALQYLKIGNVVRRKCWNDTELLYYVPEASYPTMTDNAKTLFGEGNKVKYGAYIAKRTRDNTVEIWSPQQEDIFANDWMVYDINGWRKQYNA